MKYTVVCVGKLKERFWKDACAEYTKRLGAYAKVDIREVADIDPAKAGGVDAARLAALNQCVVATRTGAHVARSYTGSDPAIGHSARHIAKTDKSDLHIS